MKHAKQFEGINLTEVREWKLNSTNTHIVSILNQRVSKLEIAEKPRKKG